MGTPATVVGVYGTLTINADGTYSYQATADMANVGKVDSFTYTVSDPVTGRTDTATLHVQVGSPDVDVTEYSRSFGRCYTSNTISNS